MRAPASNSPVIEFWFDFSSAYGYLASVEIESIAARLNAKLYWRPFMLGAAFKVTGARGLSSTPLKSDYARRDWARLSRKLGVKLELPEGHPAIALAATRAFYWIESQAPNDAPAFAHTVFQAYYEHGIDTADPEAIAALCETQGYNRAAAHAGITSQFIKNKARAMSEEALRKGVFGSPYFFADGEPFWGWDRMTMMEEWVRSHGW